MIRKARRARDNPASLGCSEQQGAASPNRTTPGNMLAATQDLPGGRQQRTSTLFSPIQIDIYHNSEHWQPPHALYPLGLLGAFLSFSYVLQPTTSFLLSPSVSVSLSRCGRAIMMRDAEPDGCGPSVCGGRPVGAPAGGERSEAESGERGGAGGCCAGDADGSSSSSRERFRLPPLPPAGWIGPAEVWASYAEHGCPQRYGLHMQRYGLHMPRPPPLPPPPHRRHRARV